MVVRKLWSVCGVRNFGINRPWFYSSSKKLYRDRLQGVSV